MEPWKRKKIIIKSNEFHVMHVCVCGSNSRTFTKNTLKAKKMEKLSDETRKKKNKKNRRRREMWKGNHNEVFVRLCLFPFLLSFISNNSTWKCEWKFKRQFHDIHAMSEWIEWRKKNQYHIRLQHYYCCYYFFSETQFSAVAFVSIEWPKGWTEIRTAIVPEALLSDLCFGSHLLFFYVHTDTLRQTRSELLFNFTCLYRPSTSVLRFHFHARLAQYQRMFVF